MNQKYTKNCTSCLEQFETNEKAKTICDGCDVREKKNGPRRLRSRNSFLRMQG